MTKIEWNLQLRDTFSEIHNDSVSRNFILFLNLRILKENKILYV